jgi:hypothetical protein
MPSSPKAGAVRVPRVLNYSLRPAKNIERKMMGEVFARLAPLAPLSTYQYVGFGSEFFNDFSLYHQMLGIKDMISIENDPDRIGRCTFNRPYKCITMMPGNATEVLPKLSWNRRSIVWLDYTDKLDKKVLGDLKFLVSQVVSGTLVVWSVNAHCWGGREDEDTGEKMKESDWPARRVAKLRNAFGNTRNFDTLKGTELSNWGLAGLYHNIIVDEVARGLNDRNAAADADRKIEFRQCFHFRYADGVRMLTVGGVFIDATDSAKLGQDAFGGLWFVRDGSDSVEINPPTLTSREVRHLTRLLPDDREDFPKVEWLSADEVKAFQQIYRYYPVFSESEL